MEFRETYLCLPKECFPRLAYAARNVPALKEKSSKILKYFGEDTSKIDQSRNLELVYLHLFNKSSEEKLSVDDVVFKNKAFTKENTTLNQKEKALKQSSTSRIRSEISVVIASGKLKDEIDEFIDGFEHCVVYVDSSTETNALTKELKTQTQKSKILFTTRQDLPRELNNLLEKIAYEPLKQAYYCLQDLLNRKGQHQLTKIEKEQIKDLCEEILALYEVSNVPEIERPCVTNATKYPLSKEICVDIFTHCRTVEALGFHFNKLHVYLRDNIAMADNSEKEMINKLMAKHNVEKFCITLQEPFSEPMEIGSTIEAEPLNKKGSLGCYADMVGDHTSETCLLLSKHVAKGCSNINIVENVKKKIATVIPETTRSDEHGSLDIAAAVLEDNVKVGTNERKPKDSNGDRLGGSVPEISERKKYLRRGRKVHIWGLKSKPGIGVIIDESYFIKDMKVCLILIQDYDNGEIGQPFAQEGDSGSIICTDDPDAACVYAFAMLMGVLLNEGVGLNSSVKRKYLALPLEDGVKQLETLTDRKFKVFP